MIHGRSCLGQKEGRRRRWRSCRWVGLTRGCVDAHRCDILLLHEVGETRGGVVEVESVDDKASIRAHEAEIVGLVNAHASEEIGHGGRGIPEIAVVALGARDRRGSELQIRSVQACRDASAVLSGGMSLVMRVAKAVQRGGLGSASVPLDGNSSPEGT